MATEKKITKKDRYNALLNLAEVQAHPDMVEFIQHEIELLDRKTTKNGEKKVNEKMEAAKATLLTYLGAVEKASVSDCMVALGESATQFPTAVLTALKKEGKVVREVIKGKPYYHIA